VYLINERNNYIAFLKRGEAYAALEIYSAAIEDYTSAIKLNNGDARLFFDRGIFYLENKDYLKAKTDLSIAMMRNYPEQELIHYNLGIAEINLDNTTEACRQFRLSGDMAKEFINKYCK